MNLDAPMLNSNEQIVKGRIQEICEEIAGIANGPYSLGPPTLEQKATALPYAIVKYLAEERERTDLRIQALWDALRDLSDGPLPGDQ